MDSVRDRTLRHLTFLAVLASATTSFAQTVPDSTAADSGVATAPSQDPSPVATSSQSSSESGATLRTAGLVVGGVGVAGLAVFTVTAFMAKSTFHDLQTACATPCTDAGHLDQIDHGKSLQTTANVSLAVGLVGLGSGAVLFLLGQVERRESAVSLSPLDGGGMVSYGRRF